MPVVPDLHPRMLGALEEKVCFFPWGFFFPSGFIKSSAIGFHWVETMINARVVNASVEQTWAKPPPGSRLKGKGVEHQFHL